MFFLIVHPSTEDQVLSYLIERNISPTNFMVSPCINNSQHFVFQLMHTTLKNVELLKHFKIRKLLQHVSVYKETIIRKPQPVLRKSSTLGSKWIRTAHTRRCQWYGCILCALCEGILYALTQCTVHTPHRSQYAAITLITSCTSSTYPLWNKRVSLAKYWLWLPDDGFLVNRNMLEQLSYFKMF